MSSDYDTQPSALTDASFFQKVPLSSQQNLQHKADLIKHESKMMTQFQEMLALLKSANNVQRAPIPANLNNKNNKTKKNNTGKSQNQCHKYCWTQGSCAHTSKECNHKAVDHKDDATFSNMLGGSSS